MVGWERVDGRMAYGSTGAERAWIAEGVWRSKGLKSTATYHTAHGVATPFPWVFLRRQHRRVLDPAFPGEEPDEPGAGGGGADREVEGGDGALAHRDPLGEG